MFEDFSSFFMLMAYLVEPFDLLLLLSSTLRLLLDESQISNL